MSKSSDALARLRQAMPSGGEDRPQQVEMAEAIERAIATKRHVIVEAGTGTGKSFAYLIPTVLGGKRAVIATATKALQDQLAGKDLPFLVEHGPRPFEWAVLKGRSNYVCLQRLRELQTKQEGQLEIEDFAPTTKLEISKVAAWAASSPTGDLAEMPEAVSEVAQRAVTVGSDECPGATRCPMGQDCFAERARALASVADVVVVNLHLYGLNVAAGGVLLPEHDVVVIDEAHQLEDIMSDTVGIQIGPGRCTNVAAALRKVLEDPAIVGGVAESAQLLRDVFGPLLGRRIPLPFPDRVQESLVAVRERVDRARQTLMGIKTDVDEAKQRVIRAQQLATRFQEHIDAAIGCGDGYVAFVSGTSEHPRLEIAPLDVGPVLDNGIWKQRTAVLTSATIPSSLAHRVGIEDGSFEEMDVGSPFDFEHNSLLYCAMHVPDPRSPKRDEAVHEEIAALITAAGGRTLALFTSWRAMEAAAEAVRLKVTVPVITQRDLPKHALVRKFTEDEETCLFATAGFFQGVDIPGRTLSLVIIDKIPFPRPDDPLLSARRELLGPSAFSEIDLPRASMLLAQATGRLIRTASDRGVVAVLDPRLGTARYRWDVIRALPPMKRTRHRAEAESFLREITADGPV